MFSYLKKGRHFLAVHLLRRSLPHGMICPFYLLPFPPKNMRIHRRIWQNAMPGLPLWAYFSVELALWLRWVLFSGWRATFRAVQKHGIRVKDRTGMGRFAQFIRVGARALFFCIPPHEIYAFRLFDRKAGQKVTDYIFTNEVTGFHRVRNMGKNICRKAALLLQDKYAFTNMARSRGLPVVPILALVKKGEAVDPLPHLEAHDALFLKPRKGSGAKDAFVISKNQLGVPAMFHTKSGMKAQPAPISDLSKAMQKRDYIISPLMINHPMLAGLASLDDAVTIRVITECGNDSKVKIYCAMLEVPRYTQSPKGLRPNAHRIVPIDPVKWKYSSSAFRPASH